MGNRKSDLSVAIWLRHLLSMLPSGANEKGKSVEDLFDALDGPGQCQGNKQRAALFRRIQNALRKAALDEQWGPNLVCQVESDSGMREVFVIDGDKTTLKTYWKWRETKSLEIIPPRNEHACLVLLMIEKRLKDEIPPATLNYLKPFFDSARQRIKNLGDSHGSFRWQRMIVNQSPTQFLKPTRPNAEVHDVVLKSLYEDCQLQFSYLKSDGNQYKNYTVCPLGVLMRGPVTYLIAAKLTPGVAETASGGMERMFALHRIRKPVLLPEFKASRAVPTGMSLEGFLKRGGADFVIGNLATGKLIRLEAEVSNAVASRFEETPLAGNQSLTRSSGDDWRLSAELPITKQLCWWLLGFGPRIKVLSPPDLRTWIASEHRKAADLYN